MLRILVALLVITLFATPTVQAQSVGEIVNHIIEALGGRDKLQAINSLYQEGNAVLDNGTEVTTRTWRVYDRLYRQEIDFGVGNVVIIVTPKQGWIKSPRTGGAFKAIPPDQLKALQTEIDPAGVFLDYRQKGNKIENVGTDTLDGRPCYRLKVWFPSVESLIFHVDQKSWYVLKETRRGEGPMSGGNGGWGANTDGNVDIGFGDYKVIPGGYVLPYSITIGGLGKVNITKVQVNGNVNLEALSKPR